MSDVFSYKAIIQGAYGEGNLGDDALMVANINLMRQFYQDEDIAIVGMEAAYLGKTIPRIAVYPKSAVSKLKADIFVYGGGTQFFSFTKRSKYHHKLLSLARRSGWIGKDLVRYLMGGRFKATAALGIGIGPFGEGTDSEASAQQLVKRLDFVAVRDAVSSSFCKKWDKEAAILGADLCYLSHLFTEQWTQSGPEPSNATIGIIVRDWPHSSEGAAYFPAVLKVASELREKGRSVEFVLLSCLKDSGVRRQLVDDGWSVHQWDPMVWSFEGFIGRFRSYSLCITARYHGALFSAMCAVPVIFVEVEQKLAIASEAIGSGQYLWKQPFNAETLIGMIENIESDQTEIKIMTKKFEQQADAARRMVNRFQQFLSDFRD